MKHTQGGRHLTNSIPTFSVNVMYEDTINNLLKMPSKSEGQLGLELPCCIPTKPGCFNSKC